MLIDEVDVILGELASNAVRYGADPMAIAVIVKAGTLEICTFDSGGGYDLGQKLEIVPTGVNGRGLRILKAFANRLHVCHEPNGEFCVCASIALA